MRPTVDLQAGDVLHVEGVSYMRQGWATVRSVSRRKSPMGLHWVSTDRGTFLADPDALHRLQEVE